MEAKEEFLITQIWGPFEHNRANGSIKHHIERKTPRVKTANHSTAYICANETKRSTHLKPLRYRTVLTQLNQKQTNHRLNPKSIKLTESTGVHIQETGSFPETNRLWRERNQILRLERTRIVDKSKDNERIQEYRPTQQGREQIWN